MAGRHNGDTKEFRDLSFADQAKSITATINDLQAVIAHHIEHSPQQMETIDKCLAQVNRLRQRLRSTYGRQGAHSRSWQTVPGVEVVPWIHVGSPRLAEPERSIDFTMEVAEEYPDAGLR